MSRVIFTWIQVRVLNNLGFNELSCHGNVLIRNEFGRIFFIFLENSVEKKRRKKSFGERS